MNRAGTEGHAIVTTQPKTANKHTKLLAKLLIENNARKKYAGALYIRKGGLFIDCRKLHCVQHTFKQTKEKKEKKKSPS